MQSKMEKLISFIETYGEEFLEDGIKNEILKELKKGNENLAKEITNAINEEWFKKTKELGKFYIYKDFQVEVYDEKGKRITKPFYNAKYISHEEEKNVPTLKKVIPKTIDKYDIFNAQTENDEWER
ncbi:MAG: hypothetical protein IKF38_05480 [Clostridia bacterium]|nr:hypothetical protein [Clostridia bacterium]